MQGVEGPGRELWDAGEVVGHLVAAGSMFGFLAEHRADVFPDETYADLFAPPGVGRPSLPATRMAAVLTCRRCTACRTGDSRGGAVVICDGRSRGVVMLERGRPSSLVYGRADRDSSGRIGSTTRSGR